MATQEIICRYFGTSRVNYAGKNSAGNQRCKCKDCGRIFLLSYSYKAYEPGVKEQIVEMAKNASGIRDTARVLQVDKNTVMRTLREKRDDQQSK